MDGNDGSALVPAGEFGPLDALSEIAHALYADGFAERCVAATLRWEPLARAAGDVQTERFLRYSRTVALQQLGRYDEAIDTARSLLAGLGERDVEWRAKALAVIAESSPRIGLPGRALTALAEADGLCAAAPVGTYGHISATMAVALALRSLELFEQADERLRSPEFRVTAERALFAAQERAQLTVTWGVSLLLTGADAAPQFRRTAELGVLVQNLGRVTGRPAMVARGVLFEAHALMRLGERELAEARARSVTETFDQRPELVETQLGRFVHASTAVDQGRYDDARELLEKVVADARSGQREVWMSYAHAALAQVDVIANGEQRAVAIWRNEAQRAMGRLWAEREARFEALRQREAVRRLTAETDRMGRVMLQDPLTGLGNRLMLNAALESRAHAPAVVFVDVDDFKAVNDKFTHAVGDDVLCRLAQVLRAQCRAEDVVVRYGGDEFVVITTTDDDHAEAIAHRVQDAVASVAWSDLAEGLSITVSVGVGRPTRHEAHDDRPGGPGEHGGGHGGAADGGSGVARAAGGLAASALAMADAALLEAKRAGRNRVVSR